ncbi:MAG: hypothetical protein V4555_01150 [Acidobacteriota bacterium]
MKIASVVARYLLGVLFVVFGLNGFLHFIPMAPPPGVAGQFLGAIFVSHFYVVLFLLQLVGGLLLLSGRYVALGLVLLAPVIVNIVLFHVFMAPSGLPMAALIVVLWLLVAAGVRTAFAGILQARAPQAV